MGPNARGTPPSPSPWSELAPAEFLERAREFADFLNVNSQAGRFNDGPTRIPTDQIVGEDAVDQFGMPGDFNAAKHGVLAEECRVTDVLLGAASATPARAFKLYETGFVGLLVEHAPTGEWTLLVPDQPPDD